MIYIIITLTIIVLILCAAIVLILAKHKKIISNNLILIALSIILTGSAILLVIFTNEINDKLEVKTNIVFESNISNCDTIITEAILLETLNEMNVNYPDVILAQAKIESNNFQSDLFKNTNNLFGMKNPQCRVNTSIGGYAGYAVYNNWRESVIDYLFWVKSHKVDQLNKNEYIDFIGKIYAEDPKYKQKIIKLVNK